MVEELGDEGRGHSQEQDEETAKSYAAGVDGVGIAEADKMLEELPCQEEADPEKRPDHQGRKQSSTTSTSQGEDDEGDEAAGHKQEQQGGAEAGLRLVRIVGHGSVHQFDTAPLTRAATAATGPSAPGPRR